MPQPNFIQQQNVLQTAGPNQPTTNIIRPHPIQNQTSITSQFDTQNYHQHPVPAPANQTAQTQTMPAQVYPPTHSTVTEIETVVPLPNSQQMNSHQSIVTQSTSANLNQTIPNQPIQTQQTIQNQPIRSQPVQGQQILQAHLISNQPIQAQHTLLNQTIPNQNAHIQTQNVATHHQQIFVPQSQGANEDIQFQQQNLATIQPSAQTTVSSNTQSTTTTTKSTSIIESKSRRSNKSTERIPKLTILSVQNGTLVDCSMESKLKTIKFKFDISDVNPIDVANDLVSIK